MSTVLENKPAARGSVADQPINTLPGEPFALAMEDGIALLAATLAIVLMGVTDIRQVRSVCIK